MESAGRVNRIRDFPAEDISEKELGDGKYFSESNNIFDNGEFHVDAMVLGKAKDNTQAYRKKGDIFWKVDLQQCGKDKDKSKSKSKGGAASKRNSRAGGKAPTLNSGFGITYGVVLVNMKLQAKPPAPAAFRAAMLHACQNANYPTKSNQRYYCDVRTVLFQEDRSWVDIQTGETHEESEYTEDT